MHLNTHPSQVVLLHVCLYTQLLTTCALYVSTAAVHQAISVVQLGQKLGQTVVLDMQLQPNQLQKTVNRTDSSRCVTKTPDKTPPAIIQIDR